MRPTLCMRPANHAVSLWADLADEHPWLGAELSGLFAAAKAHARKTGLIKTSGRDGCHPSCGPMCQ